MTIPTSLKLANTTALTLAMCEKFVTASWSVSRYADVLTALELRNAGKRGKRCARLSLMELRYGENSPEFETAVTQILALAQRDASVEEMRLGMAWIASSTHLRTEELTLRGVDVVRPSEVVRVDGPKVRIEVSPTEFSIRCKVDDNNEPTLSETNRTDPGRVLAWTKENADKVQGGMSFHEVWTALQGIGVRAHHYCAMD